MFIALAEFPQDGRRFTFLAAHAASPAKAQAVLAAFGIVSVMISIMMLLWMLYEDYMMMVTTHCLLVAQPESTACSSPSTSSLPLLPI